MFSSVPLTTSKFILSLNLLKPKSYHKHQPSQRDTFIERVNESQRYRAPLRPITGSSGAFASDKQWLCHFSPRHFHHQGPKLKLKANVHGRVTAQGDSKTLLAHFFRIWWFELWVVGRKHDFFLTFGFRSRSLVSEVGVYIATHKKACVQNEEQSGRVFMSGTLD